MLDRTRIRASTATTDPDRRRSGLTVRGLIGTVVVFAAIPAALAWPATVAATTLAAIAAVAVRRFVGGRDGPIPVTPGRVAAAVAGVDRDDDAPGPDRGTSGSHADR